MPPAPTNPPEWNERGLGSRVALAVDSVGACVAVVENAACLAPALAVLDAADRGHSARSAAGRKG